MSYIVGTGTEFRQKDYSMQKSHIVLKKAVTKAGTKSLAKKMNLSSSLIYKWCQENIKDEDCYLPSGAANPLDRLRKIYELTQDIEIINWICQLADGFFVRNVKYEDITIAQEVFKNTQRLIKEFSETLEAITDSYNLDKQITVKESKTIRKEWEDLKRVGEAFVKACEHGRFHKKACT